MDLGISLSTSRYVGWVLNRTHCFLIGGSIMKSGGRLKLPVARYISNVVQKLVSERDPPRRSLMSCAILYILILVVLICLSRQEVRGRLLIVRICSCSLDKPSIDCGFSSSTSRIFHGSTIAAESGCCRRLVGR
jgi:hypothetical protein